MLCGAGALARLFFSIRYDRTDKSNPAAGALAPHIHNLLAEFGYSVPHQLNGDREYQEPENSGDAGDRPRPQSRHQRTSQAQKQIDTESQGCNPDHHAQVCAVMLSALAARPITTPIEPGPDSMGMAIGVREMSVFSAASSLSAGVMRVEAVTIPHAV